MFKKSKGKALQEKGGATGNLMQAQADATNVNTFCGLCLAFAYRSTAHGLPRIASSKEKPRRIIWSIIVSTAVCGFVYHSIFLISNYLSYPRMTTTEEIHADEIEFPAVTVCNLNPLKKGYFDSGGDDGRDDHSATTTAGSDDSGDEEFCAKSYDDFLKGSRTMDLSDMWMNLVATRGDLNKYGHQAQDMIAQCTYNARNCINGSFSGLVKVEEYPSSRFGLCHTIEIASEANRIVSKTGSPFGLRLTLNIEREHYLDLVSAEYGARLLVHPPGTYPSIQKGGVVLMPGTKTYVSARMRRIQRLPEPYRGCSEGLEGSLLSEVVRLMGEDFLEQHSIYTYDYCQTLCREVRLLRQCGCLEELSQEGTSCDPCNATQVACRTRFYRTFAKASAVNNCAKLCQPACVDVSFDLTTSQSEWPNLENQKLALKRFKALNKGFKAALMQGNATEIDMDFFRQNFLRVHIYLQEKNYLSIRDVPGYTLPQLFADLGGCLGLYVGVSAITIVELMEHLGTVTCFLLRKQKRQIIQGKATIVTVASAAAGSGPAVIAKTGLPPRLPMPLRRPRPRMQDAWTSTAVFNQPTPIEETELSRRTSSRHFTVTSVSALRNIY